MSDSYRIADFGPSDLLTSNVVGKRRVKVSDDSLKTSIGQQITTEDTAEDK